MREQKSQRKNKFFQWLNIYIESLILDKKRENWLRGNSSIIIPLLPGYNNYDAKDEYELGYEDGNLYYNGFFDNDEIDVKHRFKESTGEDNWLNKLVDKDFEDRLIEYLDSQLENGGKKNEI